MSYTAIVLSETSRNLLIEKMVSRIPDGWEVIAHHCTLCMGEGFLNRIGEPVHIVVDNLGISDKAIAVGVLKGAEDSKNAIPHITVAVNRSEGGKPVDSNKIVNWEKIPFLSLVGEIQICH